MDYRFLSTMPLFKGTAPDEVEKMLSCLSAYQKQYGKDEIICHSGDITQYMGLVLSGGANIESYDFDGKKSILGHVTRGQLFAETYACVPDEPLMVDVTATEQTDVLFLNAQRMMQTCSHACPFHIKLIRNMLAISAQKNLALSRRIIHTTPKTIRERLISYLSFQSQYKNSKDFTIPFDRQQLADYLNVERSALSHELGKMQSEGILLADKNRFVLLR